MQITSRRRFLQQGAVAAATCMATASPLTMWANPLGLPIGIQLYTVAADLQKDVHGTLKKLRAIGYEEVESAGFAGLTAKQFRSALDDAGLRCHSAHLSMDSSDLQQVFDDANALGAHFAVSSALVASNTSSGKPSLTTVDDYQRMAERLNEIGRKAKTSGLQYAYHNHNFEFKTLDSGKVGYDVLLKETDPGLVAFELDCGWIVAAGHSPLQYFRDYPARFKMLHIKDFVSGSAISTSLAQNLRPQGTELGRGHIDYKPIFSGAAKAGIKFYYVEQEPPFLDMSALQAATVDYQYLHSL
jgi:sugar phosphate isomerase/epimerase